MMLSYDFIDVIRCDSLIRIVRRALVENNFDGDFYERAPQLWCVVYRDYREVK